MATQYAIVMRPQPPLMPEPLVVGPFDSIAQARTYAAEAHIDIGPGAWEHADIMEMVPPARDALP